MPLKVAVDKKMLGFFFRPTKKLSVFRTRLSRANCRAASATPANAGANCAASGSERGARAKR